MRIRIKNTTVEMEAKRHLIHRVFKGTLIWKVCDARASKWMVFEKNSLCCTVKTFNNEN